MELGRLDPRDAVEYEADEADDFMTAQEEDEGTGGDEEEEEDAYAHGLGSASTTPTQRGQGMLATADGLAAMEGSTDLQDGSGGGFLHDEVLANVTDSPIPPPSKRQRCRRLLKKHPTAPKRNKTAYILFTEEKRPEIKATLPDGAHVAEVMRAVAEVWKKMTDEEKRPWKEEEEKDRLRYREALDEYTKAGGPLKILRKFKNKKMGTPRFKKDPNAPKRAPSAFLIWCKDRRKQLRDENRGMANVEISKILGDEWRAMSDELKAPFKAQAQFENDQYKDKMARWNSVLTHGPTENGDMEEEEDEDEDDEDMHVTEADALTI